MKTKEQRYREAVDRNIKNTRHIHSKLFLSSLSMSRLRHLLGIRKDDESYDNHIHDMIGEMMS